MGEPRVIKRYANRKMYDTARSCYVTLEEVADMVRGGLEIRVIDNKTKADLTEVTLAQALLDSERKRRGTVPLSGIRTLISQGGDFLQKRVAEPVTRTAEIAQRSVTAWRDEAERTVQTLVHEAETLLGMASQEGGEAPPATAAATGEGEAKNGRFWPLPGQFPPEDWQKLLDEQVRTALTAWWAKHDVTPPTAQLTQQLEQLEARESDLRGKIAELEGRIAQLERRRE